MAGNSIGTHGDVKKFMPTSLDAFTKDEPVTEVPLWCSCRLVYTVCAFLTMFNLVLMRYNLSFALVCMVRSDNSTPAAENQTSSDCPVLETSASREDTESTAEFEWNKVLQGRILSAFFYGYIVCQGFGGWFSDRFGGKLLFILGNFLQSLITLLLPAASRFHPEALFALRVLQGTVCGLSLPSIFQLYTRWASPAERTVLVGFAYMGFPFGNVIIFPLSAMLCQSGVDGGWPMIFYVTGTFGVLCSGVFCFLVYDNADKHPRISAKERNYLNNSTVSSSTKPKNVPWKSICISRAVNAYHITHFCYSWGFITLAVNLPLFMKEVLYFDLSQNGFLSSLPYIGMLVMRLIISSSFTPVQKWTGLSLTRLRKINHTIGTVGAGVCMLIITALTCQDQYLAVALITLSQAVSDLSFTGGYLLSYLDLAPHYAGLLMGVSNTIGSLAGVIVPTLVGILTPNGTRAEWMSVIYITTGFYFLGAITYLLIGSSELEPWAKIQDNLNEDKAVSKHPDDLKEATILPEFQRSLLKHQ